MECAPAVRLDTLKVAAPALTGLEPMVLALSRNCTVPVAVAGVTFAVKVTAWPMVEGFSELATAVVEAARTA